MLGKLDTWLTEHPKRKDLHGWRRFIVEFWFFGLKEARACLFAGLFFIAMFLVPKTGLLGISRYDLLLICKPPPTFALCCSNFCTLGSAKVSTAFALYRMMRNKKSDAAIAFYFTNYIRPILHWFYQFYFFRPYKPIQVE